MLYFPFSETTPKRKKAKEAAESALYWANWQREKEIEQQRHSEAAQKALEASQREEAIRKQAEQKKIELEAFKAAKKAEEKNQAQLAAAEADRKRLEAAKRFNNLLD
ncbi:MAG: hypothetical protein E6Q25_08295 [Acinetobacter sp.]|nr:MAG: hypothetical protein E6Q25_08295 [Acinetobacter sp.]